MGEKKLGNMKGGGADAQARDCACARARDQLIKIRRGEVGNVIASVIALPPATRGAISNKKAFAIFGHINSYLDWRKKSASYTGVNTTALCTNIHTHMRASTHTRTHMYNNVAAVYTCLHTYMHTHIH